MRLTNKKTGDSREATVPREIVQLKAQGYAEEKPVRKPAKKADTDKK